MRSIVLVLFFATMAQAGNRTMCNNTRVLAAYPFDNLAVSIWSYEWLLFEYNVNYCSFPTVNGCPYCTANEPAGSKQNVLDYNVGFFDENDCWGQDIRTEPTEPVLKKLWSKRDYINRMKVAGCNVSKISCAYAYEDSFCPGCSSCCPACPGCPSCSSCCSVTEYQLSNEKDETKKMRNIAIAVSLVAFVVGLGLGSTCGAYAQERSARAQQQREEGTNVSSSEINLRPVVKSPRRTSSQSRV